MTRFSDASATLPPPPAAVDGPAGGTAKDRASRWLRRQIQTNVFPVTQKLPSIQALAKQLNTSAFTVQSALEPLVADGLLERRARVGIFVKRAAVALKSLALYYGGRSAELPNSNFYGKLTEEIKGCLAHRDVQIRIWLDTMERKAAGIPPEGLMAAAANREVQAMVVLSRDKRSQGWIEATQLPLAIFTQSPHPCRIGFSMEDFVDQSLAALAEQGARRIAVASSWVRPDGPESSSHRHFYEPLHRLARHYGLEVPEPWLRMRPPEVPQEELDQFGYDAVRAVCRGPELPDGVVVYSDEAARGAVVALSELGLGQRVRGVFHTNQGINLFAPFSYTAIQTNVREAAQAALSLIERQLQGLPPGEIALRHHRREYVKSPRAGG